MERALRILLRYGHLTVSKPGLQAGESKGRSGEVLSAIAGSKKDGLSARKK
jgi:hypothetical protein